MNINITLLSQYLANAKCPTQIILDTDDQQCVLRFLRGPDENGSLAVFLSYDEINQILLINDVESKMIGVRDLPYDQIKKVARKRTSLMMYFTEFYLNTSCSCSLPVPVKSFLMNWKFCLAIRKATLQAFSIGFDYAVLLEGLITGA